ncbi:discoidin domain-containing protein [Actinoallomurus sp. NPDC050550]|uniref:galactose-binding domain-containing protein n=1 Tax=Actinoallomurus sp. NPDC050550 TaxID=3154937 RepID=UPI0033F2233A
MSAPVRLAAGLAATLLTGALGIVTTSSATAAPAPTLLYAAPGGSGQACTRARPCSVPGALERERQVLGTAKGAGRDVVVLLADGTYRLTAPLRFGPDDSGRNGHRVIWSAAPGAHPVLSGATRVQGWRLTDPAKHVWSAPVPADLETRQIYVDGREAPIAQTTPAEQGVTFAAADGGYTTSPDWVAGLRDQIGAAAMARVEFVYTAGNGDWTQSRCRVGSVSGATVQMQQPCWRNITARPVFTQASGGLPNMKPGTAPTRMENAYPFLHPGQWYLDAERHVLDYVPQPGQDMARLDIEAPRLTSLLTGTGTLDRPVHDITFTGLRFAYATWNEPSSAAGFADVQDNLRLTGDDPAHPQGTCTFGNPPGTCPFGSLTREPGGVQWHAAQDVTFVRNSFTGLGAAGLVFEYGSRHNTVEGNVFSGIAGNGVILGDTTDPHPSDVGADDREINEYNTIDDNLIEHVGTDYPSAAAVTLFFGRHTSVAHNDIRDVPYTGISAGVIQGHVDNVDHPDNTTNVNSDNTISGNLIHGFMQVLSDGGAIYVEGQQGQTIRAADGTVDRAASIAHGLHAQGNVAYDQGNVNFTWYDDAGAEWIHWDGNVEWNGKLSQGGCQTTGHFDVTGNHSAQPIGQYHCNPPGGTDVTYTDNATLPLRPMATDLPTGTVGAAGLRAGFRDLVTGRPPLVRYAQAAGRTVFVAGDGFTAGTRVSFTGRPADGVRVLSPAFLVATAPSGTPPTAVTVTTRAGTASGTVPPPNVALGKQVAQSSTVSSNYPASYAVDDDLNNYAGTKTEAQPWWQVDAGAPYPIERIAVYNRADCCAAGLADYYVFVSDAPFSSTSVSDTLAQPGVWSHHETVQAGRPTTIPVGHGGRYVRVQLAGTGQLALAEVQVLTAPSR